MNGSCPVCVMITPATPSPDPRHAGLVRLALHTHPLVAHLTDLFGDRDLLMICIGSRDDVHPYTGSVPRGGYIRGPLRRCCDA